MINRSFLAALLLFVVPALIPAQPAATDSLAARTEQHQPQNRH